MLVNLKDLRKTRGITQQSISNYLGITRAAYTNIENGKRETDFLTIKKLADYFNVAIDYLFGNTDDPTPPDKKNMPPLNAEARINRALEDIGLLKAGEELTVEEQLRIADFLIRNKEFILPEKNKDKQTHD